MTEAEGRRRDVVNALADKTKHLAEATGSGSEIPLGEWRRRLDAIREDADALDSVLREMRFSGRYA